MAPIKVCVYLLVLDSPICVRVRVRARACACVCVCVVHSGPYVFLDVSVADSGVLYNGVHHL